MSTAERVIQEALEAGGDAATAFLWRRVCRDLDGELRIGVAGRDEALVARTVRALARPDLELVTLRLEGDAAEIGPTLGAQDRLLGVHALLWVTPVGAPLGAEERAGLEALVGSGAPARRAVLLGDTELLARMSDDPEAEAAEVASRARALVGRDWTVLQDTDAWLATARGERLVLTRARRKEVAHLLLGDALRRAREAEEQAAAELGRVDALLGAEDAALEEERRKGRRVAAHLLGAVRRQTERLLLDLRAFLRQLEADLPAQVEAVPDLDVLRRALPHWLHQVVEHWMTDRLARWRADLVADLAELELDDDDVDRAELLVPALHGKPLKHESGWATRLGVTATIGGGAALLAIGLWLPGLLAVTGGLAWSALGRSSAVAAHRRGLLDASVEAVRQMAGDADRLLRDQIEALELALQQLGDERAEELARERADQRAQLRDERAHRDQRHRLLTDQRELLERRVAHLAGDTMGSTEAG
ncbi:MAG: hypothetical protein H6738_00420 [Alphaproteobacteria bacterium]|nr:hypothetical protein [Alphaproteobacteria bacterium]